MAFENTRRYALPVAVVVTLCACGVHYGVARLGRYEFMPQSATAAHELIVGLRVITELLNVLTLGIAWTLSPRRWVVVLLALIALGGVVFGDVTLKHTRWIVG